MRCEETGTASSSRFACTSFAGRVSSPSTSTRVPTRAGTASSLLSHSASSVPPQVTSLCKVRRGYSSHPRPGLPTLWPRQTLEGPWKDPPCSAFMAQQTEARRPGHSIALHQESSQRAHSPVARLRLIPMLARGSDGTSGRAALRASIIPMQNAAILRFQTWGSRKAKTGRAGGLVPPFNGQMFSTSSTIIVHEMQMLRSIHDHSHCHYRLEERISDYKIHLRRLIFRPTADKLNSLKATAGPCAIFPLRGTLGPSPALHILAPVDCREIFGSDLQDTLHSQMSARQDQWRQRQSEVAPKWALKSPFISIAISGSRY